MKTFMDLALANEIFDLERSILIFVDDWHSSDSPLELIDWLGFSEKEYARWVEHPKDLALIISERQKQ